MDVSPEKLRWAEKLAADGNRDAQAFLGNVYYMGLGRPRDFARAAEWYLKAGAQGDIRAQERLHNMYYRGRIGGKRDPIQAAFWAKAAAESGNVRMQAELARMYLRGYGIEKDLVLARAWFVIAELYGYYSWLDRQVWKLAERDLSETDQLRVSRFVSDWQTKKNWRPEALKKRSGHE